MLLLLPWNATARPFSAPSSPILLTNSAAATTSGEVRSPALADIPVLAGHPRVVGLIGERRQVLARYVEGMIAAGSAAEVLAVLAEDVAAHSLDESAQARLVRAYKAAGQRARASEVYESARRLLADELGVDPGPERNRSWCAMPSRE